MEAIPDELSLAVSRAAHSLSHAQKVDFLLRTARGMIDAGHYGDDVEFYLDVLLRTPGVEPEVATAALMARARARSLMADKYQSKANQDFKLLAKLDPKNPEVLAHMRRIDSNPYLSQPAYYRAPPEVWEQIASHIPRFHLRTWLSISSFHRRIAQRLIFESIDIYFGEDNDNMNRGLDIFDRVKQDTSFGKVVRTLRIHWSYEEGDLLDVMKRIFKDALPAFSSLREFEWIGYPEMRADMVDAIYTAHPHLHSLGLIGWHFDAENASQFKSLRKFTLRAEDDDGFADWSEVRKVLDENRSTLAHLTLGAYLARQHSWDDAFASNTIDGLTHLDLVDTRISHLVLTRILDARQLRSLTLHGTFEQPAAATILFANAVLPRLEAFRFIVVGHSDELPLFESVTSFLKNKERIRRLDLGECPWEMVRRLLPGLAGLRVFRVRIPKLNDASVTSLVKSLPSTMVAIHLSVATSDQPLNEYSPHFFRFPMLSMLHLTCSSVRRPQPSSLAARDFQVQTDTWAHQARSVPYSLPSLDFLGWHGEHYAVVRGVGVGKKRRVPGVFDIELKELPARRRLDCGKGVDLGGEDASWLERKDVPIDYEMTEVENEGRS